MQSLYAKCPHCGRNIPRDAIECIYCQREVYGALGEDDAFRPVNPRLYFAWAGLGLLSGALGIGLGSLLILLPIESSSAGAPGSSVTSAFALVSCIFGLLMAPLFGFFGGRLLDRYGTGGFSSLVGAVLGGLLYAVLALAFGIVNLVTAG